METALSPTRVLDRVTWLPRAVDLVPALLTGAIYLDLVRRYSLIALIHVPQQDLGKLNHYRLAGLYEYALLFLGLFIVYLARLGVAERERDRIRSRFGEIVAPIAFATILLFLYPIGALDVFDYVADARLWVLYHQNPFVHVMTEHPLDPLVSLMGWNDAPAAYGGLWLWISAPAALINSVLGAVLYFKVIELAAFVANLLLTRAIARRVMPGRVAAACVLFGWNPLVLIETVGNAHNDGLMMALALAGVYLYLRRADVAAPGLIAASALIKFVTGLLWPLVFLAIFRQVEGWRARALTLAGGLVASAVVVFFSYAPFWRPGIDVLTLERRKRMFQASFDAVYERWLALRIGEFPALAPAREAAEVAFGLALVVIFGLYLIRGRGPRGLLVTSYALLLAYAVIAGIWFQPWYLVWVIAFAAIVPAFSARLCAVIFTLSVQWIYVVFDFLYENWHIHPLDVRIQAIAVAGVFLPPLIGTAVIWLERQLIGRPIRPRSG